MISPCACKGGQKFVHVECLRKWQRAVIVTQPTHPALYRRDERQETCNVCKAKFDPPPPSRAVLMAGFTGEEVAGLLHAGCLIVCERRTSRHMATLLRDRGVGSLRHWVRGVYLITATHEGRATDDNDLIVAVNLTREVQPSLLPSSLRQMAQRVAQGRSGGFEMFGEPPSDDDDSDEDEMEAESDGEDGGIAGQVEDDGSDLEGGDDTAEEVVVARPPSPPPPPPPEADLTRRRRRRRRRCRVRRAGVGGRGGGRGDRGGGAAAVAAAAAAEASPAATAEAAAAASADAIVGAASAVEVRLRHYIGGPCPLHPTGLTLLRHLEPHDVQDLDGLSFGPALPDGVRWVSGDLSDVCAAARVEAAAAATTATEVKVFWGDARWSRAQLLGEIARGNWGVCHAGADDVAAAEGASGRAQWRALVEGERLALAPRTEMTEEIESGASQSEDSENEPADEDGPASYSVSEEEGEGEGEEMEVDPESAEGQRLEAALEAAAAAVETAVEAAEAAVEAAVEAASPERPRP